MGWLRRYVCCWDGYSSTPAVAGQIVTLRLLASFACPWGGSPSRRWLPFNACILLLRSLRDGPRHAEWQEDAFGLLAYDPDLLDAALPRRKPAYEAHRTLVGALVGTRFQRDVRSDLGLPAHARAFRFVGAGSREVTVLWTTSSSLRVRLPLAAGAVVARQVAMDGTTTMVPPAAAGQPVVELTVSQDPIFVEAVR